LGARIIQVFPLFADIWGASRDKEVEADFDKDVAVA